MGPGRAAEIIREGLYRGADGGYLLTDRAFAGADTLATSYALATAIKKIGDYDIIIGGDVYKRQGSYAATVAYQQDIVSETTCQLFIGRIKLRLPYFETLIELAVNIDSLFLVEINTIGYLIRFESRTMMVQLIINVTSPRNSKR